MQNSAQFGIVITSAVETATDKAKRRSGRCVVFFVLWVIQWIHSGPPEAGFLHPIKAPVISSQVQRGEWSGVSGKGRNHLRPETTMSCECKHPMDVLVEAGDGYTAQPTCENQRQSDTPRADTAVRHYGEILHRNITHVNRKNQVHSETPRVDTAVRPYADFCIVSHTMSTKQTYIATNPPTRARICLRSSEDQ
jgi:hypothetical protein